MKLSHALCCVVIGQLLSGCVVYSVASTAVKTTADVVGTTVGVATDVVGGAVDLATGGGDDDEDKDKDKDGDTSNAE